MNDGAIKGTGNSRYLKSVSNFLSLYPTYSDFVNALMAGNLPIDFNGINSAGWQTIGTALNKANLLSDATASKIATNIGVAAPSTPSEALSALAYVPTKIAMGSYSGTGVGGSVIPLSFRPKRIWYYNITHAYGEYGKLLFNPTGTDSAYGLMFSHGGMSPTLTGTISSGNTVTSPDYNQVGYNYIYIAEG